MERVLSPEEAGWGREGWGGQWQEIKADGSDLMESADAVTVNHSKENTEMRRSTQHPLTS